MYTYSRFILLYGRDYHNVTSTTQLYSNKSFFRKSVLPFPDMECQSTQISFLMLKRCEFFFFFFPYEIPFIAFQDFIASPVSQLSLL